MANLGRIISTFLAALIGGISVIAGTRVLLNIDTPGYQVLDWLVVYNILLGLVSLYVAFSLWKKPNYKLPARVLLIHFTVLVLLVTLYRDTAARDSIRAMSFRSAIWTVILLITYLRTRNEN